MNTSLKVLIPFFMAFAALQAQADDQKVARKTEGLFSKKDMNTFLDDYRHDDQDAYGSETFDYTFKYANCWKNAEEVDCKLYYNKKIVWYDKIAKVNGVYQVIESKPAFPYVEILEPAVFAPKSHLKSKLSKKDDKKHSYDAVCVVTFPAKDFSRGTVFGGKHDDVKPEFKELFDNCLSAGDKFLVEKLQSAKR